MQSESRIKFDKKTFIADVKMKFLLVVSGVILTLTCLLAFVESISLNNKPLIGCSGWCQYAYPCLKYLGSSLLLTALALFWMHCLKSRHKSVSDLVKFPALVWLISLLGVACLFSRAVILLYLVLPATADCADCDEAYIRNISCRLFVAVIFGIIFIVFHFLHVFIAVYKRSQSYERVLRCRSTTEKYTV